MACEHAQRRGEVVQQRRRLGEDILQIGTFGCPEGGEGGSCFGGI